MHDLTSNYLMEAQIRRRLPFGMRLCPGLFFISLSLSNSCIKNLFSCQGQGGAWRTYAAVVWEAPYEYDKGNEFFYLQSLFIKYRTMVLDMAFDYWCRQRPIRWKWLSWRGWSTSQVRIVTLIRLDSIASTKYRGRIPFKWKLVYVTPSTFRNEFSWSC